MTSPSIGRAGTTLLEALVALVVGLLVVSLGLSTLARFETARADMIARIDALVTFQLGRHVLRSELRDGVAGRDWSAFPDSLALRAFRGGGPICEVDSVAPRVLVSFRGLRAGDPSKDSVLLVRADGSADVRALVGRSTAASPCFGPGEASAEVWTLDRPADPGVVAARIFERGSYHLQASALRYRRGPSGRQPLTPEVLSTRSGWTTSDGRLGMELIPSAGSATWSDFLAWQAPE